MAITIDTKLICNSIFEAATPIIRIKGLESNMWHRDVPQTDGRYGPWKTANYEILDEITWKQLKPCLYLVRAEDGELKYVGISANRLKDRWRVSPAISYANKSKLPVNQLFHSQCWKHIEREFSSNPSVRYEVRCIDGERLSQHLQRLGPPLSGFCTLADDHEGIVAAVERWMCNQSREGLITWNIAMTGRARRSRIND